jgi:hypothetical protein
MRKFIGQKHFNLFIQLNRNLYLTEKFKVPPFLKPRKQKRSDKKLLALIIGD